MGKSSSCAGLLVALLLCIESMGRNSTLGCIEVERQALLKFKQSFQDPNSNRLSSWKHKDCCKWEGVSYNKVTRHVVKLDLGVPDEPSNFAVLKAYEVSSSLVELKYLNYLDLRRNDFQGGRIPKFFGLMKRLRHLDLSFANFSGRIPPHLGNLTSLRFLGLTSQVYFQQNYLRSSLDTDDARWLSRLSSLQHLDMSQVNLSEARDILQVLSTLPSLSRLSLHGCKLDNTHIPHGTINSTFLVSVQFLDLSTNAFLGSIPDALQNMTSLKVLDFSDNIHVNSSVPRWFGNFKSLVHLNLANNEFDNIEDGTLFYIIQNACYLKSLDLSQNQIQGKLSGNYGNLSTCIKYDLETLDSFSNELSGPIPSSLGKLSSLRELDLSHNQFNGTIPASFGKLLSLRKLDLSNNQLKGSIPDSLGQLSNLELLDVSFNSLEGVVSELHFANLSRLKELDMSSNLLTFKVKPTWIPPFQLKSINMGSCKIGTDFPQWLQTQMEVVSLDLSNASISGTLPKWLQHLHLSDLDLSHNQIIGPLPQNIGDVMPELESLLLSDNLFNGSIPNSLCKIESLYILDLSNNRLSGQIPHCWKVTQGIEAIKLSSNKLSGIIPSSIGHFSSLKWLHLNNNSLNGELPLALRNCNGLVVLDLGENELSGIIPTWIGESLRSLRILRLQKNNFNGSIPSQLWLLSELQMLDLAANNLTGTIPYCFGNLSRMASDVLYQGGYDGDWDSENMREVMKGLDLEYTTVLRILVYMDLSSNNLFGTIPEELTLLSRLNGLNLSHNHLSGTIPENIGNLTSLESLDFSGNKLSGPIPKSMSSLTSLGFLNSSYNNFSGQFPEGNQLQTLIGPSIYAGNPLLCGSLLPKKCPGHDQLDHAPTSSGYEDKDHEEDELEKVWFYIVIMLGFATGFCGVIGVLMFKKSWRHAYFKYIDETKDRIYVAVVVKVARLKKKLKRNQAEE